MSVYFLYIFRVLIRSGKVFVMLCCCFFPLKIMKKHKGRIRFSYNKLVIGCHPHHSDRDIPQNESLLYDETPRGTLVRIKFHFLLCCSLFFFFFGREHRKDRDQPRQEHAAQRDTQTSINRNSAVINRPLLSFKKTKRNRTIVKQRNARRFGFSSLAFLSAQSQPLSPSGL